VRRAWPEVLERLRELRKTPWTFVKDNTEPIDVSDDVLVLGVRNARLRDTLAARDDYIAYLHQAVTEVLGRSLRIEAVVQPGPGGGDAPASPPAPRAPAPRAPARRPVSQGTSAARTLPGAPVPVEAPAAQADPDVAPDDDVIDEVSGADLLSRELGARIIDVVDET
jgi:DNA polymerase-3 subunit gamma/tau